MALDLSSKEVCVSWSVLNVKALVGTFNQEKALVGAFSVIRDCTTSPINRFAALFVIFSPELWACS